MSGRQRLLTTSWFRAVPCYCSAFGLSSDVIAFERDHHSGPLCGVTQRIVCWSIQNPSLSLKKTTHQNTPHHHPQDFKALPSHATLIHMTTGVQQPVTNDDSAAPQESMQMIVLLHPHTTQPSIPSSHHPASLRPFPALLQHHLAIMAIHPSIFSSDHLVSPRFLLLLPDLLLLSSPSQLTTSLPLWLAVCVHTCL